MGSIGMMNDYKLFYLSEGQHDELMREARYRRLVKEASNSRTKSRRVYGSRLFALLHSLFR